MALKTRQPTGLPAYPLILLDGQEKSGKSYRAFELSASEHVGRTFVFDLGDGVGDEYKRLGPYELVELTGTYMDLKQQIKEAIAEPRVDPDKPNVGILDSGDQLWETLKDEASMRARGSKANRAKLKEDPDAYIDVTSNYWNDAAERWAGIINPMRRSDMIWIVTAKGDFVTKFDHGQPVAGQQEWSTQSHKSLPATVNVWIQLLRDGLVARVVGVRSLDLTIPQGGLVLPQEKSLEHLIFDVIGAGGFNANTSPAISVGFAKADVIDRVLDGIRVHLPKLSDAEQRAEANRIWKAHAPNPVPDEFTSEQVTDLMDAVLAAAEAAPDDQTPSEPAGEPQERPADSGAVAGAGSATAPPTGLDPGESSEPSEPEREPQEPETPEPAPSEPEGDSSEPADAAAVPELPDDLPTEETHEADIIWLAYIDVPTLERIADEVKRLGLDEVAVELKTAGRVLEGRPNAETRRWALTALGCRREMEKRQRTAEVVG